MVKRLRPHCTEIKSFSFGTNLQRRYDVIHLKTVFCRPSFDHWINHKSQCDDAISLMNWFLLPVLLVRCVWPVRKDESPRIGHPERQFYQRNYGKILDQGAVYCRQNPPSWAMISAVDCASHHWPSRLRASRCSSLLNFWLYLISNKAI